MPGSLLRAVVIGAGWAGEGHVKALRHNGVDVVAICARQPEVVQEVARRLEVSEASTDWRETIVRLRPDVVTLATPTSLRAAPIELSCELGCHVVAEKSLATNAPEAKRLFELAERAGVKHAYGTIHGYAPTIAYATELARESAIGTLRLVERTNRFQFYTPLRPWGWVDSIEMGGGLLAAGVVHHLSVLERLVGAPIVRAVGEARLARERAPYVPGIHDFRDAQSRAPTPEEAERLEWRSCDADGACTALLRLAPTVPGGQEVQAVIVADATTAPRPPGNGWRLHGDRGTLIISESSPGSAVTLHTDPKAEPESLAVPKRFLAALPKVGDELQDRWGALFREFLADIQGKPNQRYPTFLDAWRYQVVVDSIRAASGWQEVPT
jgi:predicted dehydrogenase